MLEFLTELDTKLLLLINGWRSEGMDPVMVWISGKSTWWPFYLAILGVLIWIKRWKTVPILLFVILCITLADQTSVHLFKEVFQRLRPCHDPALSGLVHTVNGKCGGSFGFVSSHAANSFAVAVFLLSILRQWPATVILLFWAALVSYSRVYLGVHFPFDIAGGALLGALIGFLMSRFYFWLSIKYPEHWNLKEKRG